MSNRNDADLKEATRLAAGAAEWLVRLETEGSAIHAEFLQWLRQSPQHVREFLAVSNVYSRLNNIDANEQIDVEALLEDTSSEVVRLNPGHLADARKTHRPFSPDFRRYAAMLVAAVLLTGFLLVGLRSGDYATDLGEQRIVKLSDGSLIQLNTVSRVRVRYSKTERRIELLQGEAVFTVARNPSRPFIVDAGTTSIIALGTEFNVYRKEAEVRVSVLSGRVQVDADAASGAAQDVRVAAGEQAVVERGGGVKRTKAIDSAEAVSWRQRRLIFRDTSLAEAANEFNRYNAQRLTIVGDELRRRQITGVFNADRPDLLVLFLQKDYSLRTERRDAEIFVRER